MIYVYIAAATFHLSVATGFYFRVQDYADQYDIRGHVVGAIVCFIWPMWLPGFCAYRFALRMEL